MERQKYISYLKVIGIILVVFGHSFHEWNGVFEDTVLYRIFMVMRMPLFTFTSGYTLAYCFMSRPTHRSYGEFVINKSWRLLLPFLVLNTVTFFPRAMLSAIADESIELTINNFINCFLHYGTAPVLYTWFLQMSFICMLITYPIMLCTKQISKRMLWFTVLLTISLITYLTGCLNEVTLFSLNEVGTLLIFFVLGAMCGTIYKSFISKIPWTRPLFLIGCVVGWAGCFFLNESLQSAILQLCSSIFGIMMTISIALLLEKHKITILNHLSGSTYLIFLLSWYVNVASQQVLHHFLPMPWWVHTTLSWVGGIYVPVLVHRFLNYHKECHAYKRAILFLLGHK